ncbi:MAG: hypothetical protein ACOYU0_01860 [Nitrospirota bacterium]
MLVSTTASYIGHGTFFFIALHRREAFIKFTQKLIKVNLAKLESLMVRYGIASIFISQWLYGFRLLSAAVLGLSRMGRKIPYLPTYKLSDMGNYMYLWRLFLRRNT